MTYKRIITSGTATIIGLVVLMLLFIALTTAQVPADEPLLATVLDEKAASDPNLDVVPSPMITFPDGPWPWYAQEEISVHPEPPVAGQPVELCAEVISQDANDPQAANLLFGVAPLNIGLSFTVVGEAAVEVPPLGAARGCIIWIPDGPGPWSIDVQLEQPGSQEIQHSQRNLDMSERLEPSQTSTLTFPVGNPFDVPITVSLGLIDHGLGWNIELSQDSITHLTPGEQVDVDLLVTPIGMLPPDLQPVVDVQAFVGQEMIGGFRKIFRPPVPLHRAHDPFFAETEISVHPYPPRAGEPTELCVELFNWSEVPQPVDALFSWAQFGIGMPFQPIDGPIEAVVPPGGRESLCINWIPPISDQFCIQVELHLLGEIAYQPQFSQRNLDVIEQLQPGESDYFMFPVGNVVNDFTNPDPTPMTVTLEADIHLPGWEVDFQPSVLGELLPEEFRMVTMTVTPPPDPLPASETPVVDVRALVSQNNEIRVLGGFRKIAQPPVPLHPFPDPPYAEREITIHPYPPRAGEPTELCVELRNPTPFPQDVVVHFAWANFGIGLPFTPINGPREVHLPPHSVVRECIHWVPPVSGHICLQVTLDIPGYAAQRSQRNLDVYEPLMPGVVDSLPFTVGNPFEEPITITFGLLPHLEGWEFEVVPPVIADVQPGELHDVELLVQPPPGTPLPAEEVEAVDVEAYGNGMLIGGFRKIVRPPIPLHPFPDPPYAEREITIHPYPPRAGEPTELCVELRNPTPFPQDVVVHFAWASFGIGLPFTPINGPREVHLPPFSMVRECIHWVPPVSGHICLEVTLDIPGYAPQRSQRNLDVYEPLMPGVVDSLPFTVSNPFEEPITITFGLLPHLEGWEFEVVPPVLVDVQPGELHDVELLVQPPPGTPLPAEEVLVVDVEAYGNGILFGGFRKIAQPPIPLHPFPDPPYAEREITIHPYPPRTGEPTELCVDLRNPTPLPQDVVVNFSWANFGIGLPFTPINGPRQVHLPPHSIVRECIHWVPPTGGQVCVQVSLELAGHEMQYSQLNIDMSEPLEPLQPHSMVFPVGNPTQEPLTITLGLIPHLPDWDLELDPDVLPDMQPGESRDVTLTVTPPADLPEDGQPVVDVEASARGALLGGFRKIFRPPVPVHRPRDPIYAESEIGVDPYPAIAGQPTELSVEVFNPTANDRIVTATFSIAPFGIGLPFESTSITPNPIKIFVPAHGAARGHVVWQPPDWSGKFCVMVTLQMEGQDPVWSQRNIDVGEPLEPGGQHELVFLVGNPTDQTADIELGLVKHRPDWLISLSEEVLKAVVPGQVMSVSLSVTPPQGVELGLGEPIVDVEAFIKGVLIGGFRKLDRPPVPLHKPHEKGYAESEIIIDPYPPKLGVTSHISTVVQNASDETMTVDLEFGWAKFGMGIPFTSTGMSPISRSVSLGPAMTETVGISWQPSLAGHQCVMIALSDPSGTYEPQLSQRNVDVVERPPCGQSQVFTFTVQNDSPYSATVDIGLITFNVPGDWQVTTNPSTTLALDPFSSGTVTVTVHIPCSPSILARDAFYDMLAIQAEAGSVPTVDVEGYIQGELVGGIEIQFTEAEQPPYKYIYLPLLLK